MAPSIEIDVDSKYIVEVLDITEQPAQFDNSREGDMSMTWKFRLYDVATGVAVLDDNTGDPYEMWNFTSDKTYANVKTGKKAKAREWTEALVGRDLSDDEMNELIDLGFADSLRKKRGLADLEWYTTKAGNERLRIIRLRPYKKTAQANPTTAPGVKTTDAASAPAAATAPGKSPDEIAKRRAALGLDDAAD